MTKEEVMLYLKSHGNEQTKKIYLSHGAKEPLFGVKMGDLKALKKKIKTDHRLALELYQTENSDAMYFAGMIVDYNQVTIDLLDEWADLAYWDLLSERCVAVVAAKSPVGFTVARQWIKSKNELIVMAGYSTYTTLFSVLPDHEIDLSEVKTILEDIGNRIHQESLRLQNSMNNFVVLAGIYIKPLYDDALKVAQKIGKIKPVLKENSCNIQSAVDYLTKYEQSGKIGVKIKNLER